jgi:hypothetical protein
MANLESPVDAETHRMIWGQRPEGKSCLGVEPRLMMTLTVAMGPFFVELIITKWIQEDRDCTNGCFKWTQDNWEVLSGNGDQYLLF